MRRIIFAALLAISLGGCAAIQKIETAYHTVTETTVSPKQIYIAAQTFNGLQATATQYLVYCRDHLTTDVCSADNRRIVIRSIRKGRSARNQLETYITQSKPAPATLYNVLVDAITSINNSPATKVPQ